VSPKHKKGMNDLMHMSPRQIQMMITFDKYKLLLLYDNIYLYVLKYVIKEINLLFFRCVHMFRHKSKRKCRMGDSLSSSQAWSGTSADLFAVMVLHKFFYTSSFIINLLLYLIYFVIVFVCRTLWHPNTDRRPFLKL
jgi:hypothetical protein